MKKCEQIYEGKAKKVFATDDPNLCIVDYKDDATAFNGQKKGTIVGKGVVNNRMSNFMFQLLEKHGVKTHFVEELSDRETLVKKVSIVPLEVIIRNLSAGSFAKRYGVEEGIVFDEPPSSSPIRTTTSTTPHQQLSRRGPEAGHLGRDRHHQEVRLPGQRLPEEDPGRVRRHPGGLQAGVRQDRRRHHRAGRRDQPDTCRFWDSKTGEKLDKDRFRRDLGNVEGAYQEMARRLLGK